MSVAKVIELSAQSKESFEDAISQGVKKAGDSVKNIKSAWVKDQEVLLKDGQVDAYRVNLKLSFVID